MIKLLLFHVVADADYAITLNSDRAFTNLVLVFIRVRSIESGQPFITLPFPDRVAPKLCESLVSKALPPATSNLHAAASVPLVPRLMPAKPA